MSKAGVGFHNTGLLLSWVGNVWFLSVTHTNETVLEHQTCQVQGKEKLEIVSPSSTGQFMRLR